MFGAGYNSRQKEVDELRAEVTRLHEENDGLIESITKPGGLYDTIEQLRAALADMRDVALLDPAALSYGRKRSDAFQKAAEALDSAKDG